MKNIIIFLFLINSLNCSANDWTEADTRREATYMVLHAVDWAQTRYIARNPDKFEECGIVARRFIGSHPTIEQVDAYIIGSAILQYAIAKSLPNEYRSAFQYLSIIDAGFSVAGNFRIGVRMEF